MKNQTYRMTMLFDFYGELLTDRQKEFFDLYYNEDLSLSEIAENEGISRQGVRDVIVRAEAAMQEIEDKTGLIRRFEQFRGHLDAIRSAAEDIRTLNYRQYEDSRLTAVSYTHLDVYKRQSVCSPAVSLYTTISFPLNKPQITNRAVHRTALFLTEGDHHAVFVLSQMLHLPEGQGLAGGTEHFL